MPKVAVVIPARYASTRLPGKPLIVIAGKPLVQHVWERCMKARSIDEIIVATDDRRIAEVARGFGATVAMTSTRCRSGTDRVAAVARRLPDVDHFINVQGDEPLVDPVLIVRLARALREGSYVDMVTAASDFGPGEDIDDPNGVKVVTTRGGDALYFSRSRIPFLRGDGASPTWRRHIGIYGYTRQTLLKLVQLKQTALELAESLEQLRALEHGFCIRVLRTKHAAVGVDTPADVAAVERMLARKK